MGKWRGMALVCALALGCGGEQQEEGIQEDERPQASSPGDEESGELSALWGRPELGTARLVKDLFPPVLGPGWFGPFPESLVEFRGKLFFAANFEDGRRELWKSNGTTAGTVPIKRFPPLSESSFGSMTELTPVGSRLFFVVTDEAHGRELWVSNGTTGGTRLVKDIVPGPDDAEPFNLTAVGSTLLFFRFIPSTPTTPERTELWRSDGTEAGTVRVKDLGPESSLSTSKALLGNTLFFVLSDPAHGTELWKTDGTSAGTGLVKDILPGPDSSGPFNLRVVRQSLFFTILDPATGTGSRLWRTDGTEAGTRFVLDLIPEPGGGFPRMLDAIGSCLYFSVTDFSDHLLRLYRLKDGPKGVSVKLVATLPNPFAGEPDAEPFITTSTVAGKKLFFVLAISTSGPAPRDTQLWVTDGTDSGTKLLHRPLSLSDEFGSTLFALDDRVLFSGADESGNNLEPWVSDGSVKGTRRLQDIARGEPPTQDSSFPRDFTRVGSQVFFVANDVVHGNELWVLPLLR